MRPCPAGLSVLRCFTAVTTNWDSVRSMPAPVDCRCRGRQTSIPTRGFATAFVRGPAPMERGLPPYSTVPALRRYHEEHASHIARRAGTMMSLPGVLRIGAAAGLVGVSCIANGIDAGSQPNDLRPRIARQSTWQGRVNHDGRGSRGSRSMLQLIVAGKLLLVALLRSWSSSIAEQQRRLA